MPSPLVHTYSIVAYDSDANQLGVAVHSHYFGVGGIVAWAEAGIGAIATQSVAEVSYGPLGLALLRAGKTPEQTLEGLLKSDPGANIRQVAMVDGKGSVATHTGSNCIAEAGHRLGSHYSVQANLMLKDTVWDAMAEAFERATGDLGERMLVSLEAAEAEGGDIRGKQSAALLVVSGQLMPASWSGRIFDLRVEDNPEPLKEMRRLLAIAQAYQHAQAVSEILHDDSLDDTKFRLAADEFQKTQTPAMSDNPELTFWYAVDLASAGQIDTALPLFERVFAANPQWRDLITRLAGTEFLPDDSTLIQRILQVN